MPHCLIWERKCVIILQYCCSILFSLLVFERVRILPTFISQCFCVFRGIHLSYFCIFLCVFLIKHHLNISKCEIYNISILENFRFWSWPIMSIWSAFLPVLDLELIFSRTRLRLITIHLLHMLAVFYDILSWFPFVNVYKHIIYVYFYYIFVIVTVWGYLLCHYDLMLIK